MLPRVVPNVLRREVRGEVTSTFGDEATDEAVEEMVAEIREAVEPEEVLDPRQQAIRDTERVIAAAKRALKIQKARGAGPEALQAFKLALGLDPTKAEHHAAITDALRLKESQEHLQAGKKLQNLGRVEEALAAFERTVELEGQRATLRETLKARE